MPDMFVWLEQRSDAITSEMSSSLLPAALRRRRMGLALELDIGSLLLLSYGISHARKELTSSVG